MDMWTIEWNPVIEDEHELLLAMAELLDMLDELEIDEYYQATIIN